MDNPPPIRPWFRLASQIRFEQPPQPAQPRPPQLRPTLTIARPATTPQPPPPQPQPQPPPPQQQTLPPPPQPQPQPQPPPPPPQQQTQPPPSPQPTQAPTRTATPAPVQVAEPPQPLPTRALTPAPLTPVKTSAPISPMQRSLPQPTKTSVPSSPMPRTAPPPMPKISTSVPSSPVPRTTAPPPMPKISTPQPKVSVPASPKRSTYSPPKSLSPPKSYSSSVQNSPPRPKPPSDEYFKITKPSSMVTPPHSPKNKPLAPPPSPLSLPPSHLNLVPEPESKTVVMAEPKNMFPREQKEMKHDEGQRKTSYSPAHSKQNAGNVLGGGTGGIHQKKENKKSIENHEEDGVRVITIAGENKGAYMELGSSKNKPKNLQARTLDGNDSSTNSSSSSNEANSKKKGTRKSSATTTPTKAFVNSNVQGVNNSILFNSTCTHSDPGVHLLISKKPTKNPTK